MNGQATAAAPTPAAMPVATNRKSRRLWSIVSFALTGDLILSPYCRRRKELQCAATGPLAHGGRGGQGSPGDGWFMREAGACPDRKAADGRLSQGVAALRSFAAAGGLQGSPHQAGSDAARTRFAPAPDAPYLAPSRTRTSLGMAYSRMT